MPNRVPTVLRARTCRLHDVVAVALQGRAWKMQKPLHCKILLGLAVLLLAPTFAAADATYTYTGDGPYTSVRCVGNGCDITPGPGPLTISFTLPTALPDNMVYGAISPTSFTFSDGGATWLLDGSSAITSSSIFLYSPIFNVSTDASGNIDSWKITAGLDSANIYFDSMESANIPGTTVDQSVTEALFGLNNTYTTVRYSSTVGSWTGPGTLVTTPEPSTLLLLASGALGVFGVARRRIFR